MTAGRVHWRFENAGLEETVPLDLISPPQGAHLLSARRRYRRLPPRRSRRAATAVRRSAPDQRREHRLRRPGGADRRAQRYGPSIAARRGARGVFAGRRQDLDLVRQRTTGRRGRRPDRDRRGRQARDLARRRRRRTHWITTDFGKRWQKAKGVPDRCGDRSRQGRRRPLLRLRRRHRQAVRQRQRWRRVQGSRRRRWANSETASGRKSMRTRSAAAWSISPRPGVACCAGRRASWSGCRAWRTPIRWAWASRRKAAVRRRCSCPERSTARPACSVPTTMAEHWQRIDDDAHRYGKISLVTGDPRLYGRVYFAGSGRGIVYGDPR